MAHTHSCVLGSRFTPSSPNRAASFRSPPSRAWKCCTFRSIARSFSSTTIANSRSNSRVSFRASRPARAAAASSARRISPGVEKPPFCGAGRAEGTDALDDSSALGTGSALGSSLDSATGSAFGADCAESRVGSGFESEFALGSGAAAEFVAASPAPVSDSTLASRVTPLDGAGFGPMGGFMIPPRAARAAVAAISGDTADARKLIRAITGFGAPANGSASALGASPKSPLLSRGSRLTSERKVSSMGSRRNCMMQASRPFVPTCSATRSQFSAYISRPSSKSSVSSRLHTDSSRVPSPPGIDVM
mmetsp:Transcript_5615/g.13554  ORF Transcript_5615/g.13554 Transcript_5615/m.13554 type:complete len:305 (-) Transcript_5615:850-1764(-)